MALAPAPGAGVEPVDHVSHSGSWTNPQNWSSSVPNGVGGVANLWTVEGGTIDLGSSQVTLSTLSLHSTGTTSYDIIATAGGSLVLQGSGGQPATVVVLGGSHTIAAPVTLSTPTDVAIDNSTESLAITGAIGGSGALNLSGNGTLVLSGSDNYGGGTIVESGTLVVNQSAAIPYGSSLTVEQAARLFSAVSTAALANGAPLAAASDKAVAAVPEPGTAVLLAIAGLTIGLAGWRRSHRRRVHSSPAIG